ncbi:Protein of unknown function (DUF565) [Synechococcus sp. PCC 7502]|uniref:DUF565 domain-containing protein n=1 Tax=Synechococcus sp. PCC 7502 TaxID=1173263 RepID=UPI00029F8B68|nr:DUF565 domain-containing protein [Synechococcus sp. PCC 7502]AFY72774.1 Protein of unknown function (DUF565) [Synechococcus sp. PCC 7502]
MQNTRLTVITNTSLSRLERWFSNPWRRISLYIISPLLGFFLASIISTVSGAKSAFDPYVAAALLLVTELISFVAYRRTKEKRSLYLEILNLLKIGLIYGMFLEAFKLGS